MAYAMESPERVDIFNRGGRQLEDTKSLPRCYPCGKYSTCVRYHTDRRGVMYRICCQCSYRPPHVWPHFINRVACKHSQEVKDIARIPDSAEASMEMKSSPLAFPLESPEQVDAFKMKWRQYEGFPRCELCGKFSNCVRFHKNDRDVLYYICCQCLCVPSYAWSPPLRRKICVHTPRLKDIQRILDSVEALMEMKKSPLVSLFESPEQVDTFKMKWPQYEGTRGFPRCELCGKFSTCVRFHKNDRDIVYRVCCRCLYVPSYEWSRRLGRKICVHALRLEDIPRIWDSVEALLEIMNSPIASSVEGKAETTAMEAGAPIGVSTSAVAVATTAKVEKVDTPTDVSMGAAEPSVAAAAAAAECKKISTCDVCGKKCFCLTTARNRHGDFYSVCCKCIQINDFFWSYKNKKETCEHVSR